MFSIQRAVLEEQRVVALELDRARQLSQDLGDRISRSSGILDHNFNNLLSIIKLNCDRLEVALAGQERPLRLVEIISGAAARGSAITRSLMTLSNQRSDTLIPVAIDALFLQNQAFLASTVGMRDRLRLDLGTPGAKASINPAATLNCLLNLLINARDAMPKGGEVTLTTRLVAATEVGEGGSEGAAHSSIAVTDTGVGMAPEVLDRAFEPFYSTKRNGNGLGLASVLEFVVNAGGNGRIAPTLGTGSSVFLACPASTWRPLLCRGLRFTLWRPTRQWVRSNHRPSWIRRSSSWRTSLSRLRLCASSSARLVFRLSASVIVPRHWKRCGAIRSRCCFPTFCWQTKAGPT